MDHPSRRGSLDESLGDSATEVGHEDGELQGDRLNIAIVGGGSAGLVTAHLLDRVHHVTVVSRQQNPDRSVA